MKKAITFLALIFISLKVIANEKVIFGNDWVRLSNTSAFSDSSNFGTKMFIYIPDGDIKFTMITTNEPQCDGAEGKEIISVIYFENQPVKMKELCLDGSGSLGRMTVTNSGNSFIINKFKNLGSVKIGTIRWNAKGFTKQYNTLLRASKAL